MRIVISGSSGLVGTALVSRLRELEHDVVRLVRGSRPGGDTVSWDPYNGLLDPQVIEGADAVVHLSGASIAGGPWTKSRKKILRESRLVTTRLLAKTIATCERGPRTLLQASAVGYYGHRPNETLTEQSPVGSGFLATLCAEWEAAALAASNGGVRTVFLRTGLVLSRRGGLLSKLLLPFTLGLGGRIGAGEQVMSWLTLADLVEMCCFLLERDHLSGPVNCVAPHAVTNREFTRELGKVLRRPTMLPLPAFPLRLILGEMADELMLVSQNVAPKVLLDAGYRFNSSILNEALISVLS